MKENRKVMHLVFDGKTSVDEVKLVEHHLSSDAIEFFKDDEVLPFFDRLAEEILTTNEEVQENYFIDGDQPCIIRTEQGDYFVTSFYKEDKQYVAYEIKNNVEALDFNFCQISWD